MLGFSQHSSFTSFTYGARKGSSDTFQSLRLSVLPGSCLLVTAELIQKKLQGEMEKQLQKDLSKSMTGRQKCEAQLTENTVKELDGSNMVFRVPCSSRYREDSCHSVKEARLYHR